MTTTGSTVRPPYPRLMMPGDTPADCRMRQSISTNGVLFVPPRVMLPTLITGISGSSDRASPWSKAKFLMATTNLAISPKG